MAAAARRLGKVLGAVLAGLVLALALFALAGWIGSSIPRNRDWREPADGIEIMVGTNGVHTELVLPLVTPEKDWRAEFPATDVPMIHTGSDARFFLLAGTFVGENALLRFYVLHCVFLPVIVTVLIAIHFWRIRKDGGISGPL